MSEKHVQDLTKLYNTLLLISTRGEETMIMAECLKVLQRVVEEGAKEAGLTLQRGPIDEETEPEHVEGEEVKE